MSSIRSVKDICNAYLSQTGHVLKICITPIYSAVVHIRPASVQDSSTVYGGKKCRALCNIRSDCQSVDRGKGAIFHLQTCKHFQCFICRLCLRPILQCALQQGLKTGIFSLKLHITPPLGEFRVRSLELELEIFIKYVQALACLVQLNSHSFTKGVLCANLL